MGTTHKIVGTVVVGLVTAVLAAQPEAPPAVISGVALGGFGSATYELGGDSVFAQGCMGGGPRGCMCPLQASLAFTGRFSLKPIPHTPQGHTAFEVTIREWLVDFGNGDIEVSGDGHYDRWSNLDGTAWHRMTLDLEVYDEVVPFDSGVELNPTPGGSFPAEINISLDYSDGCFGYVVFLEAERLQALHTGADLESGRGTRRR